MTPARRSRKSSVEESGPAFALPDRILLAGFMGTGKSSVGRRLAEIVKRPFVDLDRVIESSAGMPVAEIITRRGEPAFRAVEAREAARVARLPGTIVAAGGGTLLDDESRAHLLAGDTRVFVLTASLDEIVRRVAQSQGTRPLLAGGEPERRIAALLAERREHYASLGEAIDTTGRSVEETAREIVARIAPGAALAFGGAERDGSGPAGEDRADDAGAVLDAIDAIDASGSAAGEIGIDERSDATRRGSHASDEIA